MSEGLHLPPIAPAPAPARAAAPADAAGEAALAAQMSAGLIISGGDATADEEAPIVAGVEGSEPASLAIWSPAPGQGRVDMKLAMVRKRRKSA